MNKETRSASRQPKNYINSLAITVVLAVIAIGILSGAHGIVERAYSTVNRDAADATAAQ